MNKREKREKREKFDRLSEIREEMVALLEEAKDLVRELGSEWEYNRAKAYWMAAITTALSENTSYLGRSMCSMEKTIDALAPDDEDDLAPSDDEEDAEEDIDDEDE